jgi:hypothetical protein
MQVRVMDLQSFDETLDLPDAVTVNELRDMVQSQFNYDLSDSAFYHSGAELLGGLSLKPSTFSDSNVLVLFNSRVFPQKSFPRVDQAFHFFASRLQEHYIAPGCDEEPDVPGRPPCPAAGFRHFADASALSDRLGAELAWGEPLHGMHDPLFRADQFRPLDELAENEEPELTPADLEAVRRLEELGVDRATVIAAYVACDRNESQTENWLMHMSG